MASLHGLRVPTNLNNSDFSFATGIKKPTATAEQLDSLYFREKEAPKHGNLDLGDVAYELCQLDASLDELFREAQAHFSTHQQIHKFRLRVSRRISAFAAICRKLFKQIEIASSPDALRLRSLHRFYMDRLMRHKNNLSEWWSRNERLYHSMCLSSYVSEADATTQLDEDEDTGCDSLLDNVGEDESELVLKLKATRNMMLNQIKQMNAAESSMLKSSNYIIRQDEILDVLKKRFGSASQLFISVRRKTINRYGTVRLCYFVFLGSCGFITLRRFRIFKLTFTLARFALNAPFKILKLFYRS